MSRPVLDRWQFRISPDAEEGARPLGRWFLASQPDLPVTEVRDAEGRGAGVLLGFPIDLGTRRMDGATWTAPGTLGADVDGFAAEVLDALGGLFVWVFVTESVARIYPDASAQVPVVFDPADGIVGSTAHALFDDAEYDARFDRAAYDRLGVDGEGWFPAGLTAHRGLERLLPNHVLDLETWTAARVPSTVVGRVSEEPDAIVDEIIDVLAAQVEALVEGDKRPAFALTGGHETRVLLSLARPWLDRVDFVTVTGAGRHQMDSILAGRIAADLGLNHILLPRLEGSPEEAARFIRRGGHCNADSNARFHPSVRPIAESHVFVGGLGGEFARAFFWRDGDTDETPLTSDLLTGRFGLPRTEILTERLDRWLREVPQVGTLQKLDLAYVEHRNGAWASVQFCSDPTLVRQAPLITRRTADLMMQLPPEWKRGNRLGAAIIARLWPELDRYPYNTLGPWRDRWIKLQRVLENPRVIVKKLRKMRA